jgi:hypothetical protein
MYRSHSALLVAMILTVAGGHSLIADVKTDEKTRVQFSGVLGGVVNLFGGKAAREGVKSTVAVKGDRKATTNDNTGRIIDLAEEKIYDLDLRRKTYKVTTFAELRKQMEDARRRAEEESRKAQAREKDKTPERDPNAKEMEVDFDVKDTGQKKSVAGYDTHEVVLTITVLEKGKKLEESGGLLLTSDMWLAPSIAALKEIREFDVRYAQKLAGPVMAGASAEDMGRMLAAYPMMKDALAKMAAEGNKLEGTPLSTVLTFEMVKSAAEAAQESKSAEEENRRTAASAACSAASRAARASASRAATRTRRAQPS